LISEILPDSGFVVRREVEAEVVEAELGQEREEFEIGFGSSTFCVGREGNLV
jgi:hypothetical protein